MTNRLSGDYGRWIDRSTEIRFRFDGREFTGVAGDTISSALWANGVRVLGRSFKYHRPRGVWTLADADCNAMVESDTETNIRGDITPIRNGLDVRAVNTAGGADRDWMGVLDHFGAFTPVGFYYKAFHTPKAMFPHYERQIRAAAGLGRVNTTKPLVTTPKDYAFCDVAVIGAGSAGLAAAVSAASAGAKVMLIDENPTAGGSLLYQAPTSAATAQIRADLLGQLEHAENIELRLNTRVAGCYSDHWLALVNATHMTKLRAQAVIYATGSWEQPAVFPNNDLPGVMMASAAQRLIHLYAVRPCETAVILTANSDGYRAALDLHGAGITVAAVLDIRQNGETSDAADAVRSAGIAIHNDQSVYDVIPGPGKKSIRAVRSGSNANNVQFIPCDGLLMSVGWAPADGVLRQAGVAMEYCDSVAQFIPKVLKAGQFAAGRVAGIYDVEAKVDDGKHAGLAAAASLGIYDGDLPMRPTHTGDAPSHPYPISAAKGSKNFLDLDEDIQVKDIQNAAQEGFDSIELVKRYSTVGMGPSQGKHSGLMALRVLSNVRQESMAGKQMTTARPFSSGIPLSHLAGRIFTPRRRTPTHACHEKLGAHFMHAGQWLRPEYYAKAGLSRIDCIHDEVRAVRQNVGIIDLGTLGKIEISGPDAVTFIERIYTGRFAKLRVGMSRYALMCDESGVIIDDGMIGRLAEDRFYVSTTSSGADSVYSEFQRWALMWGLNVVLVNGTANYGAFNIAGPNALSVLSTVTDCDLSRDAFPYLGIVETNVAGIRARLSKVGFVGEAGCEIHVPADHAVTLWDALMTAGGDAGIRPFGVEAQRLLRLEKGHIIVGQDTDGLTTPFEANMGWAVKLNKPFFVGQRSLQIVQQRPLTRQLVGFNLPADYNGPSPKECHLVLRNGDISGRVTSIAKSPTLERILGLAYVHPDQAEPGTEFDIRIDGGVLVRGTVVRLPFYDPDGERVNAE